MRKYVKSNILNNFIKNRSEIIYFGSTFLKGGLFILVLPFLKVDFILTPPFLKVDYLFWFYLS